MSPACLPALPGLPGLPALPVLSPAAQTHARLWALSLVRVCPLPAALHSIARPGCTHLHRYSIHTVYSTVQYSTAYIHRIRRSIVHPLIRPPTSRSFGSAPHLRIFLSTSNKRVELLFSPPTHLSLAGHANANSRPLAGLPTPKHHGGPISAAAVGNTNCPRCPPQTGRAAAAESLHPPGLPHRPRRHCPP